MPYKDPTVRRVKAAERMRRMRAKDPDRWYLSRREYHLQNVYGMTVQAWDELFLRQGRACAACKTRIPGRTKTQKPGCWHTDHNPKYQKGDLEFIRGILCHWCNIAAHKHQTPVTLRALADYLECHA